MAAERQLVNLNMQASAVAVPTTFFQQPSSKQTKADQVNTKQKKLGK